MHIIEAPNNFPAVSDVFLGGGISNCPDWQSEVIELLADVPGVALNPRRAAAYNEDIADEQITWEYHALRTVKTVFFWFPKETLCPITLLELGVFTQRPDTRLVVGTHPEYARRFDVIKQLELSRPEVKVQGSIEDLVSEYLHGDNATLNTVPHESDSSEKEEMILSTEEEENYTKAKKIAKEELAFIINKGTLGQLIQNIENNYPAIDKRLVREVLNDMLEVDFSIVAEGKKIYIRSV